MTADLEKLLAEATPGPWNADGQPDKVCADGYTKNGAAKIITTCEHRIWMTEQAENFANARLIAKAPGLARQVIDLTAENAALRTRAEKLAKTARSILNEAENNGGHIRYSAVLSCRAALTEWEAP